MNRHEIELLGKAVAGQMGDGPARERIDAQREAVMSRFGEMQRVVSGRRVTRWRWALAGTALGLLAGLLWWHFSAPSETLQTQGIHARDTLQSVQLPGGNEMRLSAGSQGSVKEASSRQVRLSLVRGTLTSIVRTPVRWCVEAGPYYVEAAGTEYTVQWEDPRLEVTVARGKVTVSRQGGADAQWEVEAGGRLVLEDTASTRMASMSPEKLNETSLASAKAGSQPPTGIDTMARVSETEEAPVPPLNSGKLPSPQHPTLQKTTPETAEKPRTSEVPDWKRFLQSEDYKSAVEALERSGLAAFADTAPLADLQGMATAARYAGKPQTALVLLVSMRTRFPTTQAASVAAFLMGRVYSEQLGDHRAAVGWFSTYLGEAPDGALAEEALGRRMDSAHRCGMNAMAQESARHLLERFPKSPFVTLARKIAGP